MVGYQPWQLGRVNAPPTKKPRVLWRLAIYLNSIDVSSQVRQIAPYNVRIIRNSVLSPPPTRKSPRVRGRLRQESRERQPVGGQWYSRGGHFGKDYREYETKVAELEVSVTLYSVQSAQESSCLPGSCKNGHPHPNNDPIKYKRRTEHFGEVTVFHNSSGGFHRTLLKQIRPVFLDKKVQECWIDETKTRTKVQAKKTDERNESKYKKTRFYSATFSPDWIYSSQRCTAVKINTLCFVYI